MKKPIFLIKKNMTQISPKPKEKKKIENLVFNKSYNTNLLFQNFKYQSN